jgi:hypothetical protein
VGTGEDLLDELLPGIGTGISDKSLDPISVRRSAAGEKDRPFS